MTRPVELAAAAIVVLAGLYLVALGIAAWVQPARASRFLLGHAGSAAAHHLELALRLVAGSAFVVHAPRMLFPAAFQVFGGVLLATTGVLLLVPWRRHRRFAERMVPRALAHLKLVGLCSLAAGAFVLRAAAGPAA